MTETYIIQKLIIELDLNAKQEYHDLTRYLEAHLYPILLEELEGLLSDFSKEIKENLVIEKLEIELEPMLYSQLKSPQLITHFKSNLKKQLEGIALRDHNKLEEKFPEKQFIQKNKLEKHPLLRQRPIEAKKEDKSIPFTISQPQSIKHYLLTGQFIYGIELTRTELTAYFEEEQKSNDLIHWIVNLPLKAQKYRVLQRIAFQIPLLQKKAFFNNPKIQQLNQSFDRPVSLDHEEAIGTASTLLDSSDTKRIIQSHEQKIIKPPKLDPESNTKPQKNKTPETPETPETPNLDIDSKDQSLKKETHKATKIDSDSKTPPSPNTLFKSQLLNIDSKKGIPINPFQNTLNTQEGFYIPNAGIVIIAPYLPALFQKGELLNAINKAFKNKVSVYYAIHLLEFLVNKKAIETEHNTLLYKLLCGLHIASPIDTQIKLEEEHKKMTNRLLQQVSNKWDIKIGTQIDMLRGSFLIREGKLMELDEHWLLTVETKLYDRHLFKKLPWSFKRIKLPWMPKWLQVDWY